MTAPRSGNPGDDFMNTFMESFQRANDNPDIGFTMVHHEQPPVEPVPNEQEVRELARELTHRIARELAAQGPEGWEQLEAVFAMTVAAGAWQIVFSRENDQARADPSDEVLELVRQQRALSARLSDGPWWRMRIALSNSGQLATDYDYGDEPFPDSQLFPPEAYLADLREYPRDRLPVWLAAYLSHGGRQQRSPRQAAETARADRLTDIRGELCDGEFPPLQILWARWTALAATFSAIGSQYGPRILPSVAWFESTTHNGASLYLLPGDRAVLSGGVWNADDLDAAYNGGHELPALYSGAPEWITNGVLNTRVSAGLLSFCFWWVDGHWYRGASPSADQLVDAIPGVWTAETVVDVIIEVLGSISATTPETRTSAQTLVAAAEAGVVTRRTLGSIFEGESFDIDAAFNMFDVAGLTSAASEPPTDPLPESEAIDRVRRSILESGSDITGFPLSELTAARIEFGWMVYVPTPPGQIMIGRAIYYIADDGVIEQSSSSVAPRVFAAGFAQRYRDRHGLTE